MCKCTPEMRTPFCGKIGCQWPKPEGTREPTPNYNDILSGLKEFGVCSIIALLCIGALLVFLEILILIINLCRIIF